MNDSITDPRFDSIRASLKGQRKGKVARTHKANTTDCRLTRTQYENLPNHEKVAVYFATDISVIAQAKFFRDARTALYEFGLTLSPR